MDVQAFGHGAVLHLKELEEEEKSSKHYQMSTGIDKTNKLAFNDDRVWNSLVSIHDGVHIVFKK